MSKAEPTTFECRNGSCTLGTRGTPGRFTGGITADGVALLTGEPAESLEDGKHFGEGFCPNCAERGRVAKDA